MQINFSCFDWPTCYYVVYAKMYTCHIYFEGRKCKTSIVECEFPVQIIVHFCVVFLMVYFFQLKYKILPHLNNCCTICRELLSQNIKFQKIILDKSIDTPSNELCKELNWMSFDKRIMYKKTILRYQSILKWAIFSLLYEN
jgi:hypothetical protein